MSKHLFLAQNMQEDEIYAGIVLGEKDYHLFLKTAKPSKNLTWQEAMDWADIVGGSLPTRQEQAILYGNLKHEFESGWQWSNEQHALNSDCAWMQDFDSGYQDYGRKSYDGRARAVRRVYI